MPRKIEDIIRTGERLMEKSEEDIIRQVERAEVGILDEINKVFDKLDVSSGKLQNSTKAQEFLMNLEEKIFGALKKAEYPDAVKKFVKSFDLIEQNIIDLHSEMNNIEIAQKQIDPFKKLEVKNTISKLTEAGLAKDFVNPVRQALYRNIITGASITDTQKFLRDFIKTNTNSDGRLLRYVKQISRDSISQFDGTVQANIATELGLNAKRYVGSLIRDSRAQCMKWVTQNNGIIMLEDLAEEIRWAQNNGTYKGKRAQGMISDTNVNTFDIYRGGYNCRHRSIPTFVRKK